MLLQYKFSNPELNLALEAFLQMVNDFFKGRLVSVVLHGSIVFDDLAPGYGDLDFLAVVDRNLSEEVCQQLTDMRKPFRGAEYGIFGQMIEGAFLPRAMLNPNITGKALWWGTSCTKHWENSELGWLVLHIIRERGLIIWGEDIRHEISAVTHKVLVADVWSFCRNIKKYGQAGDLHSIDWLLSAARLLLWLKEGKLSSKTEAAEWGFTHAIGAWRKLLPKAKQLRLNPARVHSPEVKQWLNTLTTPIKEAGEELERELIKQGCDSASS